MNAPAYPKYKLSGVEWLDKVPENWEVTRLKDCGKIIGGSGFPPEFQGVEDEVIPFYKVSDMGTLGNERTMIVANNTVSEDTAINLRAELIPADSVIYAKIGAALLLNKRRITKHLCCIDNNMSAFVPTLVETAWAYYWLSILDFGEFANPGAVPSFSEGYQGTLPFLRPPQDDQHAIADFLDVETAKLNTLIAKKRQLIEKLKEKRTALISRAVTRGLPPEAARAAGLNPHHKLKPSGIEWLGNIPEHWEVGKFSREVRIAEGQVDPEVEPYASMLLIAPNHIESATGRLLARETAAEQGAESGKYLCRAREVIYSKIRPALAKVAIAPEDCLCSADMYPLSGGRHFENRYICWLFLSQQFTAWSVLESDRVAMPKINRETLGELRMPVPPIPEQRAIAGHLDRETAKIDRMVAKVEEAIERLQEYRTALITAAVTGKIDVRTKH